jgi:hypothetical protein
VRLAPHRVSHAKPLRKQCGGRAVSSIVRGSFNFGNSSLIETVASKHSDATARDDRFYLQRAEPVFAVAVLLVRFQTSVSLTAKRTRNLAFGQYAVRPTSNTVGCLLRPS